MKKLLVLFLVFAMASWANATIVSLVDEGSIIDLGPAGGIVVLEITSDGSLATLNVVATISGTEFDAVFSDAMSLDDVASYGWDASLSMDASGIGTAVVEIGGGGMSNVTGVAGFVTVTLVSGEITVSIADGTTGGTWDGNYSPAVMSTGVVTIIPEPMTVALLGLGGLFLRRRRS